MDKYLGLDLSMTSPGFAVVGVEHRRAHILELRNVKTTKKDPDGIRLEKILEVFRSLLDEHEFTEIIRERGFTRFAVETQQIFQVVGVVNLTLGNRKLVEYMPTSIKKITTGNGKATKDEVFEAVLQRIDVEKSVFLDKKGKLINDLSDATAVALTYLIDKGLID